MLALGLAVAAATVSLTDGFGIQVSQSTYLPTSLPSHVSSPPWGVSRQVVSSRQTHVLQMSTTLSVTTQSWVSASFPGHAVVVSQSRDIAGVLKEVWDAVTALLEADAQPSILLFPNCKDIQDGAVLQRVYDHLELCKDVCERFGTDITVVPHPSGRNPVAALQVRPMEGGGGGGFAPDPLWDGDWDIDLSMLGEEEVGGAPSTAGAAIGVSVGGAGSALELSSDDTMLEVTKDWVQAVITDMGVCPFSVSAQKAGLPVGDVHYPLTHSSTAEEVYRDYWQEVVRLQGVDERSLSTTLLITPKFGMKNVEAFDLLSQTLTQPLEALGLEDSIQLVFFHPEYTFRDGQDRLGSGGAANYARRSPLPMINILRTPQVRLAQKSIPTGLVYKQNEEVLTKVGPEALQKMLVDRDWSSLEGRKVDRRQADYYRTARALQGVEVDGGGGQAAAAASKRGFIPGVASLGETAHLEHLNEEDIKIVAAGLMRRLIKKKPLSPDQLADLERPLESLLSELQ